MVKKLALKKENKETKAIFSVTRFLFVTTQIAAIAWVSMSYLIAAYATIVLGEPYPVVDLSTQAIVTILGGGILKVIQNIWQHNNGSIFGTSISNKSDENELVEVTTTNGRSDTVVDRDDDDVDVGLINEDRDF